MKCPFCNQDNTRVVDSRPVEDTNLSVAVVCVMPAEGRFTHMKGCESIPLTVIKRSEQRTV